MFNDTPTIQIYTLSLHDALPIFERDAGSGTQALAKAQVARQRSHDGDSQRYQPAKSGPALSRSIRTTNFFASTAQACCRSEEHTSELQSRLHLVCRLLLEKKNNK